MAVKSAASRPPRGGPARGYIIPVGGAEEKVGDVAILRRFANLCGGPAARIGIIPTASELSDTGERYVALFKSLGAASAVSLPIQSRADADDIEIVSALDDVDGIFLTGGNQLRLSTTVGGTEVARAIRRRNTEGVHVAGTSAGAAIMSDSMLTGNQFYPGMTTAVDSGVSSKRIARNIIEVIPGLGFLHGAIVDQHFIKRMRENRLMSVILERPSLLGVGIDESTALRVYPDGHWQVYGASAAIVFDARSATITPGSAPKLGVSGMRVSILPAGSTFDPRTGKATLPPGGG